MTCLFHVLWRVILRDIPNSFYMIWLACSAWNYLRDPRDIVYDSSLGNRPHLARGGAAWHNPLLVFLANYDPIDMLVQDPVRESTLSCKGAGCSVVQPTWSTLQTISIYICLCMNPVQELTPILQEGAQRGTTHLVYLADYNSRVQYDIVDY